MKLSKVQREFTLCIGKLIQYAYNNNYELTFGDAYRDYRVHGRLGLKKSYSSSKSVHKIRLAVDFNLFVDDEYIKSSHKVWDELGSYWKSLDKRACWGGDFKSKDYNHFSFTYWGCK